MHETKVSAPTPANMEGFLFATPTREKEREIETLYAESFEHFCNIICGLPRKARKLGSYAVSAAFSDKVGAKGVRNINRISK